MAESKERSRKMGSSPLSEGGALDWIGEEGSSGEEDQGSSSQDGVRRQPDTPSSEGKASSKGGETTSGGNGLKPGFRRHTLIMREDHIEMLNRLTALEKLRSGDRLKKDVVAEIFASYFEEHSESLSLD